MDIVVGTIVVEAVVAICIVGGALFTLIGSIGLARLRDFYMRLHGPTKATTLGVGGILLGSMIYFTLLADTPSVHEVLITVFLFFTAPVSAHMLAKAAMHLDLKRSPITRNAPWRERERDRTDD